MANGICVMDADGTNIQRLTHRPGDVGHPDWSPDGSKIVFTVYDVDQPAPGEDEGWHWDEHGIYVMDADGTNVQRLTAVGGRTDIPTGESYRMLLASNRSEVRILFALFWGRELSGRS